MSCVVLVGAGIAIAEPSSGTSPGPSASLSPIEWFFAGLLHSINSNDFAACSTEPAATGSCAGATAV